MKKVTIRRRFRSKDLKDVYAVGEVKEFDDARAESLIARGLVNPVEETSRNAEDTEATAAKGKGKKGKSSKKKDETLADTETAEAEAKNTEAAEAEATDFETDTTIPNKDKQQS